MKLFLEMVMVLLCLIAFPAVYSVNAQSSGGRYTLQVISADNLTQANQMVSRLTAYGIRDAYASKVVLPGNREYYRVRVGSFAEAGEAGDFGADLKRKGLINEYYVARAERYAMTGKSPALRANANAVARYEPAAAVEANAEETYTVDEDISGTDKPKDKPAEKPKPQVVRVTKVVHTGGVQTGQGEVPIKVPFESDDIGGGCWMMDTGQSVSSINSMGVFTVRDQVMGAIIPYAGKEAEMKFQANTSQNWTPPKGVVAADVFKMDVVGEYREFHAAAQDPVGSYPLSGGRIKFNAMSAGEYMIRGRTARGKCVFLPVSVK